MLEVKKEPCSQCLFSKERIVSNARRKDILKECQRKDTHFNCHKETIKGNECVCSGFFTSCSSNMIRIAGRLNMIKFVD